MTRTIPLLCALACLLIRLPAWADDDDQPASPVSGNALPVLSAEQQAAVGITLAHPVKASIGQAIEAYGQVLDPGALIADAGRMESSRAAARTATAEAQRLEKLYRGDAEASLKSVQTAQAAQIEAQMQAQAASSTFALQWGPLSSLSDAQRLALIDAFAANRILLLRAEIPGHLSLGAVPQSAMLQVDGIQVPARVLGTLQRSAMELQGVGLLLQIEHAPLGLGPGTRVPVTLHGALNNGVLVPKGALLYGEQGAYVYRQLAGKSDDDKQAYTPVPVKLLQAADDAWLVNGLSAEDMIVVHGAGVLWSLQGLGSFSADEEDHD